MLRHRRGFERATQEYEMPFTESNGARLHWQAEGEGTPILLIMGHRYSSAMWYPVVPALAARHRVIRFDNRGTGDSATTGGVTTQQMADDAVAVMDAAGVTKAHVFGVSMGGVIAQDLAMRHASRVTSLILGCTGMLTADKPRAPAAVRLLYYLPNWLLEILMSRRRGDQGYGSAAPAAAVAADRAVLAKDRCTRRGAIAQAKAMASYRTTKEAVAGVTMPALVLHGDEDSVVPFAWGEELARGLPDARFVRIQGAGHNFFIAGRDKANQAVLDFIDRVERKA
jgi:pimeloyl-ACP methyl ester carboxylesterase